MTQENTSPIDLQKQIREAEEVVNTLRKQLESIKQAERLQAISQVKEYIQVYTLTPAELGLPSKGKTKAKTDDKRNTVAAKYKDPDSQATWTGRGKTPAWLSARLAAGAARQDFAIT